jgi:hypothetical protein
MILGRLHQQHGPPIVVVILAQNLERTGFGRSQILSKIADE